MNWYRDLYTDHAVGKKKTKIMQEIEQEVYHGNTWLITLAANPANQLELLSVHELRFPYLRRNCPLIIGLASGKKSALRLLEQIVGEVYRETGEANIREYFSI